MTNDELHRVVMDVVMNGSRKSFKALYYHFYTGMFELARSVTHSAEAAEEIVDDVYLKLWLNREKLSEIRNLKVYLFVCVRNLSLNYLEKIRGKKYVNIEEIDFEPSDFTSYPEDILHLADLKGMINEAVNSLSPQGKLIFRLVKEEGLKYREVAEILDISVKTVEYHIGTALKRITEKLSLLSRQ
jgi:RNA polymerase sigma-70 factor (family 1)